MHFATTSKSRVEDGPPIQPRKSGSDEHIELQVTRKWEMHRVGWKMLQKTQNELLG